MTELQSRAVEYLRRMDTATVDEIADELNEDRESALLCIGIMQRVGQLVRAPMVQNKWMLGKR